MSKKRQNAFGAVLKYPRLDYVSQTERENLLGIFLRATSWSSFRKSKQMEQVITDATKKNHSFFPNYFLIHICFHV